MESIGKPLVTFETMTLKTDLGICPLSVVVVHDQDARGHRLPRTKMVLGAGVSPQFSMKHPLSKRFQAVF